MLNPFPIQFLALFAYAFVRICVGCMLLYLGVSHIKERHLLKESFSFPFFPYGLFSIWYISIVELIIGSMLVIGFYTQIAAILCFFLSLKFIVLNRRFVSPTVPGKMFYALLLVVSLSLFITGAGVFAFDLPI